MNFDKLEITPPEEGREPFDPGLATEYLQMGGRPFNVLPPLYAKVPRSIIQEIMRVVESVVAITELKVMPDIMRVDVVPTKDGELRIVEINAQIPGGTMFLPIAHATFGEYDSFHEIQRIMEGLLTNKPIWLLSQEGGGVQKVGEAEALIAEKEVWGPEFTTMAGSPEGLWQPVDGALRFMVDREFEKLRGKVNGEVDGVVNKPGSGDAGDKSYLAMLMSSPLLPKGRNTFVQKGKKHVVPEGWVYKAPISLGGAEVFFPGQVIEIPDDFPEDKMLFAMQEFIDIDTFKFGGVEYKYGLDMYFVRNRETEKHETFFLSRTCRADDPNAKLNISAGDGSLVPVVGEIVEDLQAA